LCFWRLAGTVVAGWFLCLAWLVGCCGLSLFVYRMLRRVGFGFWFGVLFEEVEALSLLGDSLSMMP
jgi:hypothetical protein